MNTYWFNKLLDLLMVQTNSENEKLMVLHLDKELKRLKLTYQIDAAGNIIVVKGKAKTYPCVVSHMDTVHDFVPNFKIYHDIKDEDILFAMSNKRRVGIGGDDKCGVFASLYLLKVIPQIKIVFFSREEIGRKGSKTINKAFFADCRYLIQLDRKGKMDFIQTVYGRKTVSHEFSSEIGIIKKKYKYKNTTGTITDVMELWDDKVGVSCINLSCGYFLPHTNYENISINSLWHSIKFVENIINTMKPKRYISIPPPLVIVKTVVTFPEYNQCHKCKEWKRDALLYPVFNKSISRFEKICYVCKYKLGIVEQSAKIVGKASQSDKQQGNKQKSNKQADAKRTSSAEIKKLESYIFACYECGVKLPEIEAGGWLKYTHGQLYCNKCTSLFYVTGDEEPKRCYMCDKIIPKDHKIIERFGIRICEDCALPSDNIVD